MSLCHLCKQVTRPKEIASDDSLEKKSQKVTILHYSLENWLPIWLSLSHLHCKQQKAVLRTAEIFAVYFGHQTRSCWNKKEKISTKTRWRPSFWNWKMKGKKVLLLLLWFDGQETEIRKNPEKKHLFTTLNHFHHQLSSNSFGSNTFGENQRSVVSFFWTKSRTVIITTPP